MITFIYIFSSLLEIVRSLHDPKSWEQYIYHARWMGAMIYVLKMILVGGDLDNMGATLQHGVTDHAFLLHIFTRNTGLPFQCQHMLLF